MQSGNETTWLWNWRSSEHWDQIFCTEPEKVSLGTIFVKFSLGIKLTELWPPASTILCTHYGECFSHTPDQPLAVRTDLFSSIGMVCTLWIAVGCVTEMFTTCAVQIQDRWCSSASLATSNVSQFPEITCMCFSGFRLLFAVSRGVPPGSVTCLRNLIFLDLTKVMHIYWVAADCLGLYEGRRQDTVSRNPRMQPLDRKLEI